MRKGEEGRKEESSFLASMLGGGEGDVKELEKKTKKLLKKAQELKKEFGNILNALKALKWSEKALDLFMKLNLFLSTISALGVSALFALDRSAQNKVWMKDLLARQGVRPSGASPSPDSQIEMIGFAREVLKIIPPDLRELIMGIKTDGTISGQYRFITISCSLDPSEIKRVFGTIQQLLEGGMVDPDMIKLIFETKNFGGFNSTIQGLQAILQHEKLFEGSLSSWLLDLYSKIGTIHPYFDLSVATRLNIEAIENGTLENLLGPVTILIISSITFCAISIHQYLQKRRKEDGDIPR
ncbi:MAG: hypothetical protein Fur0024_0120 [Patescibacteria group bacterium]